MGKDRFFNKWFWEDWITTCRGMKLDPFLILLTKVPQNGLKVYVRPQSIKLPEGKHREKLLDIGFGKYLLEMTPKLQTKKKCWLEQTTLLGQPLAFSSRDIRRTMVTLRVRP